MTWQQFVGDDQQWDDLVVGLGSASPYQSTGWANFRKSHGWASLRLVTADRDAAAQLLTKRVLGTCIAWCPGGPVGQTSQALLHALPQVVGSLHPSLVHYIRLSDFRRYSPELSSQFSAAGWHQPSARLSTNNTLVRELHSSDSQEIDGYTKNWSRNLRRGLERGITAEIWQSPDFSTVAELHQSVVETKGLSTTDWRTNAGDLAHLADCLGHHLLLVKSCDADGNILAMRGATITGELGFDFLAATSGEGRKLYASNVALDCLLMALKERGVQTYDFGGIDAEHNKGVYDFKHGAGGHDYVYVGEFEYVKPSVLQRVVSRLIASRLSK